MTVHKPKVIFAAYEAEPFMKTGGLGDVAGSLPGALKRSGADVSVVLPKFSGIDALYQDKMEFLGEISVPLSWREIYCGVFVLKHRSVTYYFLDNEHYFKRDKIYGHGDDGEKVAFFSKAILQALPLMGKGLPDVLHCNDWHTAMVPVFLREHYGQVPGYDAIKTVFTVHNLKFQGVFPGELLGGVLGLHNCPAAADQLSFAGGAVNMMQGALRYSDWLTTVSPTYAQEITTPDFGEGMEGIFQARSENLTGILNGINTALYDPKKDGNIPKNYGISTINNKVENKLALQREVGLPQRPDVPLLVMSSRLTEQKGVDLLTYIMDELMTMDVQVAVLGVGDEKYEEAFRYFQGVYPEKFAARLAFDAPLSHLFYAGGDLLLMPSQFEPCGLSQMIAMGYGTLPIVRETGGLKDSVTPYNQFTQEGNGFSFTGFNAHQLLDTIYLAVDTYFNRPEDWKLLQKSAMRADFKWRASAQRYLEIYHNLCNNP